MKVVPGSSGRNRLSIVRTNRFAPGNLGHCRVFSADGGACGRARAAQGVATSRSVTPRIGSQRGISFPPSAGQLDEPPLVVHIDREDGARVGIDLHVVGADVDVEDQTIADVFQVDLAYRA